MASSSNDSPLLQFVFPCGSRGYHKYREIWSPTLGEELSATAERDNPFDKYAVALKSQPLVSSSSQPVLVGYLPREISKETSTLMTIHGGRIVCKVTNTRFRLAYIEKKGLEIPIQVTVTMEPSEENDRIIEKYKKFVNEHYREPIGM